MAKKRRSAKQRAATRKMLAANRRRSSGAAPKRRRRIVRRHPPIKGVRTVAKRKRRRSAAQRAATRKLVARRGGRRRVVASSAVRPRRRVRRGLFNGGGGSGINGLVGGVTQGAMDVLLLLAGKVGARTIPTVAKLDMTGGSAIFIQIGTAAAICYAARRVLGADKARFVTAGALVGPIESFLKGLNIPYVSDAMGDARNAMIVDYRGYSGRPQLAGYSRPALNGYVVSGGQGMSGYSRGVSALAGYGR